MREPRFRHRSRHGRRRVRVVHGRGVSRLVAGRVDRRRLDRAAQRGVLGRRDHHARAISSLRYPRHRRCSSLALRSSWSASGCSSRTFPRWSACSTKVNLARAATPASRSSTWASTRRARRPADRGHDRRGVELARRLFLRGSLHGARRVAVQAHAALPRGRGRRSAQRERGREATWLATRDDRLRRGRRRRTAAVPRRRSCRRDDARAGVWHGYDCSRVRVLRLRVAVRKVERRRAQARRGDCIFFLCAAFFWAGFEQQATTFNLFALDFTDRSVLGGCSPRVCILRRGTSRRIRFSSCYSRRCSRGSGSRSGCAISTRPRR